MRYYLVRIRHGETRYVQLDYSVPEHYRIVSLRYTATYYHDPELAKSTVEFLGGEREGIALEPFREKGDPPLPE